MVDARDSKSRGGNTMSVRVRPSVFFRGAILENQNCIFCKIVQNQISAQVVAQTQDLLVFKDINPLQKTHLLIIPKIHVVDMKDENFDVETLPKQMALMVQKLSAKLQGCKDFKIVCNNGAEMGQEIFHLHWHFLSKFELQD